MMEKNSFRLPSKEEFEKLCEHFCRLDKESKSLIILNKDTGQILSIPSTDGIWGRYITSSICSAGRYYFKFGPGYNKIDLGYDNGIDTDNKLLVSDTPFPGGTEFNGIWWKG